MSRRPPSSDSLTQMLLMQNITRQQQLQQEQAAYAQGLEQQRAQAAASVAHKQTAMDAGIRRSIAKPVKLGTLLTSPGGILGNPVLSATRLSG